MAVDKTIRAAVEEVVREKGQSAQLAKKILAWLDVVVAGSEDVHDPEAAQRHLEVLFAATEVSTRDDE
jgi:hypothetical protein